MTRWMHGLPAPSKHVEDVKRSDLLLSVLDRRQQIKRRAVKKRPVEQSRPTSMTALQHAMADVQQVRRSPYMRDPLQIQAEQYLLRCGWR